MAAQMPIRPDVTPNLAMALVASSNTPVLLLDGAMDVLAASGSFCRAFQLDVIQVSGRLIFTLGTGEWDVPQLRSLLSATLSGHAEIEAYEMDLNRQGQRVRHLVLNAQKLDYGAGQEVRLLLTISDVTDTRIAAKLNEDLLREKAILLQEIQHRVANSLQIIASVLMQSASRVQSEETRGHLRNAHNRVMSVAAVQQQLAAPRLGEVALHPYLAQLGQSLAASMIHDHQQLSLEIIADDSTVVASASVSLGLIVTELVINALKHAFPGHRRGKIIVSYKSAGSDWTLSVSDDGIGMPADPESAKAGLGTSIVEALAKQLDARVQVTQANPGTAVSVSHVSSLAIDGIKRGEAAQATD
jgi:two-component sensor histidine kinase